MISKFSSNRVFLRRNFISPSPSKNKLKTNIFLPFIQNKSFHSSSWTLTGASAIHVDTKENNENIPFEFSEANMELARKIIAKYPKNYEKSAVIPLLDLAQRQNKGWLPLAAMNKVAKILNIPPMSVYEVASFYTMFNRTPIGKHHVQVCTTTPCMLRGAYEILDECKKNLGIEVGETTPDGKFTLGEIECAGCCVNAPMISVGDDYYEDLQKKDVHNILNAFKNGEKPPHGPQNGRLHSAPFSGKTTLLEPPPGPYCRDIDKV